MIPLVDLGRVYKQDSAAYINTARRVFQSGQYILGNHVRSFEEQFASYIGVRETVGVASGTDAISLALRAAGVGSGDGVIIPANSYPSVFGVAVIHAIPQLVDCDEETYTIAVEQIEAAITPQTKAILPVHLYGQTADMAPIMALSKKHNLIVIEDCAQAHGARYRKKKAGTFGKLSCFSFYPTKNLGALGDGGAVVGNQKKLLGIVRELRMYGERQRNECIRIGVNSRLDEIQAAFLSLALHRLDERNRHRRKLAVSYRSALRDIGQIIVPQEGSGRYHVYHLFVIRAKKRDALRRYLASREIITGVHYPVPIHRQKAFAYLGYASGSFPVSERISGELLSLPFYPGMPEDHVRAVANAIRRFYS